MPKRDAGHMNAQRERIIRAVMTCIADKGVERTSIGDICRQAGLSTGALYVHFANKDELVEAALHYGSMTEALLPDSWEGLVAMVSSLEPQMGFDIATVARIRLHLHSESVKPGQFHEAYLPMIQHSLAMLAALLRKFADRGEISLKMPAEQTARSMSAFIDGLLWIALATERPLEELRPELAAGMALFVDMPKG